MEPSESHSRTLAERLAAGSFLHEWFRRPAYEVAEAVIRLRRLRGLSQHELADRMGTKQPAIARIEAGDANLRLSTIEVLARGLEAVIRIDLDPTELVGIESMNSRWWNRAAALDIIYCVAGTAHEVELIPVVTHQVVKSASSYPTAGYRLLKSEPFTHHQHPEVEIDLADVAMPTRIRNVG